MKLKILFSLLTAAVVFCVEAGAALTPFGNEFTYQGRLNDGSSGANGQYDLTFGLYDAATAGSRIVNVTNLNVAVSNGLFATQINFGSGIFIGYALWIEIGVRTNGSPSGFTPLTPRQPITPTPNAHYAALAGTVPGGSITASKLGVDSVSNQALQNSAVTAAKIANGQVVKSVNSLRDDVTLAAGANTTITPSGNTLTIAGSSDWKLGGNSGTAAGANFIGTTDNQSLEVKVNNARVLRLEPHGTSTPSLVGGYFQNDAGSAFGAAIAGGGASGGINQVWGNYGFVGAGYGNRVGHNAGGISAGLYNTILGPYGFIGSGSFNETSGSGAGIAAGTNNFISGDGVNAFIGAGERNQATNANTVVGGGFQNRAGGFSATVAGGLNNSANGGQAAIGGGENNIASGTTSTVGGGYANRATAFRANVSGGELNTANAPSATISGGDNNSASGFAAAIGGGEFNLASGNNAAVPGGLRNTATNYAFAAGRQAKAIHRGAFVWADSQGADFSSTADDQFNIRASGGIRINDDTSISFGATTRQMLDLWGTAYGIGVQPSTLYFRANDAINNDGFAWHKGGTHAEAPYDAGGGTRLMSLKTGGLNVSPSGKFASDGDAQSSTYVLRAATGSGITRELFVDGAGQRLSIPANSTWAFDILIVVRDNFSSSKSWQFKGSIRNNGGTTAFVSGGSPTVTGLGDDFGFPPPDVTVTADNINDALVITASNFQASTLRWVATVRTVEVSF